MLEFAKQYAWRTLGILLKCYGVLLKMVISRPVVAPEILNSGGQLKFDCPRIKTSVNAGS